VTDRQARLDHLQASGRLPSVVASVLDGGRPVWTGAAGEVTGDPADLQYRIGSITKTLVSVCVHEAVHDGLLGLDDPIGAVVPETGYAEATIRELLSHRSGMQSEPVGPWWERSPGTDVAALLSTNDGSGRVAPAGEYYHYSNLGFALLAEAVARVRGAGWWDVVSAGVLGPLGLDRTTYHPVAPHAQGLSVGHFDGTLTREPHQDTGAMAPAGQVWSTLRDLGRYAAYLADPPAWLAAAYDEVHDEYALGFRVVEVDGRRMVGHTGSMPGFLASLFLEPGTGVGTVALANGTTGLDTDGVPHALLGASEPPALDPWVPSATVPDDVSEVLGLWFWGNSAFEARWHNGTLQLHSLALREHQETFELVDGRWLGTAGYHRGETLHVRRRADGTVGHLECATWIYTRTPYDPDAPVPGGHPR
jgi:CubicO group peptidase (beta-lactamase class C family)